MSSVTGLDPLLEVVEHAYGIDVADFRSLGGELDTNVYVKDSSGREFTIKRSQCSDVSEIRWQYPVLRHLGARLMDVRVPIVEPTASGASDVVVEREHDLLVIRLAQWVPGQMLGELHSPSALALRNWGHLAANCVLALSDYSAAEVPETHYWDLRAASAAIATALPFVQDDELRQRVEVISSRAKASLEWLGTQPCQVVHQDLNDFNVLVDDSGDQIIGVLDVGDAIFAPKVSEVVVASAYGMLRQDDPKRAFEEVLAGYGKVFHVSKEDRESIFWLAAMRLCVNATTWTMRSADSGDDYGSRRMAATWPAIAKIADLT